MTIILLVVANLGTYKSENVTAFWTLMALAIGMTYDVAILRFLFTR